MSFQPVPTPPYPGLVHIHSDRPESAQYLRSSVDVIYAPAAIPRAVGFLFLLQEPCCPANRRVRRTKSEVPKNFEHGSRDIAAARIENSIMIRKGHVLKQRILHILVERGPATIPVLKAQKPSNHPII